MLGISTSWKSEIVFSGREIAAALAELNLDAVELEYRITRPMLQEMLPILRERGMGVVSIHNFFPVPEGLPREKSGGDIFSLSSLEREEREMAVKWTLRTLEWADRLGARAVVLHLGKLAADGLMAQLKEFFDQGRMNTPDVQAFLSAQKEIRAGKGRSHLDPARRSLERLAREAEGRGLLLGIENRYGLQDFPTAEEGKLLLEEFRGGPLGYWHDIGHATAQYHLGLTGAQDLLENMGPFLIGVHLHGCRGYLDHLAPGGEEDYGSLKKFLKEETLRVVETHHRSSREELLRGVEFLRLQGIA